MFQFDASTVAPQQSFDVLPAGTYTVVATKAEMRNLNSGNGRALSLQFKIIEGPHINRVLFSNLNVQHNNEVAQKIGQEQLSAFCRAVNTLRINEQTLHLLCDKPVRVKVKIRKSEQYGDQNDVAGFEAVKGGATIPTRAPAPAAAPSAAPAAATPPWAA